MHEACVCGSPELPEGSSLLVLLTVFSSSLLIIVIGQPLNLLLCWTRHGLNNSIQVQNQEELLAGGEGRKFQVVSISF